jgi:GGDEF domain-containing protein
VLAPETTWGEVVALAGRLRAALATVTAGDRVLTTGIGWAIYPENGETIEELLAHADAELREDKFHSSARQPARTDRRRITGGSGAAEPSLIDSILPSR